MAVSVRNLVAGIALAAAFTAVVAAPARAAVSIDQAPSGFFVPNDALKKTTPYWRGRGQDWSWQHGAIASAITTASLSISAYDVDFEGGEVDNIYALDGANWVLLGALTGVNNAWSFGNAFTLGSQFFDDIATGLKVKIDIDANDTGQWRVTLGKSVVTTEGSDLPAPVPGIPEPSTWAMLMLGFGLVGVMARRRKTSAVSA